MVGANINNFMKYNNWTKKAIKESKSENGDLLIIFIKNANDEYLITI